MCLQSDSAETGQGVLQSNPISPQLPLGDIGVVSPHLCSAEAGQHVIEAFHNLQSVTDEAVNKTSVCVQWLLPGTDRTCLDVSSHVFAKDIAQTYSNGTVESSSSPRPTAVKTCVSVVEVVTKSDVVEETCLGIQNAFPCSQLHPVEIGRTQFAKVSPTSLSGCAIADDCPRSYGVDISEHQSADGSSLAIQTGILCSEQRAAIFSSYCVPENGAEASHNIVSTSNTCPPFECVSARLEVCAAAATRISSSLQSHSTEISFGNMLTRHRLADDVKTQVFDGRQSSQSQDTVSALQGVITVTFI